MDMFDQILNWKLKRGSHQFPGKDGGTCINEAALVAAGFPYRPIQKPEDMPSCFSRPICRFAMRLNDEASETERQRLLPFVLRLACADSPEVERARATYIDARVRGVMTFQQGLEILEGALAIGRQADPLAIEEVTGRMLEARNSAPAEPPGAGLSLLAKLWGWFGQKPKVEPAAPAGASPKTQVASKELIPGA